MLRSTRHRRLWPAAVIGMAVLLALAGARLLDAKAEPASRDDATTPFGPSYFGVVSVGAALPLHSQCVGAVRPAPTEVRPENGTANATRIAPRAVSVDGASPEWNAAHAGRIDGAFTGTTDEIIQWGACKWGADEDLTRARVFVESRWNQNQLGDATADPALCAALDQRPPCHQSYGVLQVKGTVHDGTYPAAATSTAWNVDYALAWQRACFDGAMGWLGANYGPGDLWGCVGAWYSGAWWDEGARRYVDEVRVELAARRWETASW